MSDKQSMFTPDAKRRAAAATAVFAATGAAAIFVVGPSSTLLPLVFFYALLVLNTYFSIRCFSSIIPGKSRAQMTVDAALVVLYLALALQLANPLRFYLAATLLFLVATAKYALVDDSLGHTNLLRRKIFIDTLATVFALLVVAGILGDYPRAAIWGALVIFSAANIYMLGLKPFYVLQNR